jgi:hypothetical protein
LTSLLAIHAKRPRTQPETTPTMGPVTIIMSLGDDMEAAIAASLG